MRLAVIGRGYWGGVIKRTLEIYFPDIDVLMLGRDWE